MGSPGRSPQIPEAAHIVNASRDLNHALNLLLEQLARLVPYDVDYPPDLPAWSGDFVRLSQALYQLLDNAIKFSFDGGTVTLRVFIARDKRELQIEVEDQGISIPPEEQQRIFDPFYQIEIISIDLTI